VGLTLSVLV